MHTDQQLRSRSDFQGLFLHYGLTVILERMSNYTHHEVWDEITYPFPNFNCAVAKSRHTVKSNLSLYQLDILMTPFWFTIGHFHVSFR